MRALNVVLLIALVAAGVVLSLVLFQDREPLGGPQPSVESAHPPLPLGDRRKTETTPGPDAAATGPVAASRPPDDRVGPVLAAFRGRVVDARGQPVGGATIQLAPSDRSEGIPLEDLDPEQLAWARRTTTTADADGRFQISALSTSGFRLRVRARGFAPDERVVPAVEPVRDLGDIVLSDSVVLHGRVLDSSRRPVAGAVLRRLPPRAGPAAILSTSGGDVAAVTGSDGAFRIDELATGPWTLLIKADDHPDKLERGVAERSGPIAAPLEIVLEDGARIEGKVVRAPASALEDLWVRAVPASGGGGTVYAGSHVDENRFVIVPRSARCAADGSFAIRGLTKGLVYRLAAREGRDDHFARERTTSVEARAGQGGIELEYRPPTALVFQVVDAATSEPVTEFEAKVGGAFKVPLRDRSGAVQRSFPEGRARFEMAVGRGAEARVDLVIESRGYEVLQIRDLQVTDGKEREAGVLRLTWAPQLIVHVVDDRTGAPIEGAQVTLSENAAPEAGRPGPAGSALHAARTDRKGIARVNSLPNKAATLLVAHSDYAPFQDATLVLPVVPTRDETIRLRPGARVVVEVRDAKGVAVRGARVRHEPPPGSPDRNDGRADWELVTDADGRLEFDHLPRGTHAFALDDAGTDANDGAADRRSIELSDDDVHTVALVAPVRVRLAGTVSEAGKPVSGATLRFLPKAALRPGSSGAGRTWDARSSGDGGYALSIPPGSYRVSVVHPSRAMVFESEVDVTAAARFDVVLPRAAIEGRVLDEGARPVAGLSVRAEAVGVAGGPEGARMAGAAQVITGADGSYVLLGIRPDADVVVVVEGGEFVPARSQALRVAPGQTKSGVDVQLELCGALEVRVETIDAMPAAGVPVHVAREGSEPGAGDSDSAATSASGFARFKRLKPGRWRVQVGDAPGGSQDQVVEVKKGEIAAVAFQVR